MIKKHLFLTLTAVLVTVTLLMTSCENSKTTSLFGTVWVNIDSNMLYVRHAELAFSDTQVMLISYKTDNTGKEISDSRSSYTYKHTYDVNKGDGIIDYGDGFSIPFSINKDTLIERVTNDGKTFEYVYVKHTNK